MKKAFDFFVFANFWVGLCAVAQGLITYIFINTTPSPIAISVLFLATFFIYNIRIVLNYPLIIKNKDNYTSDRMKCVAAHVDLIRLLTIVSVIILIPLSLLLPIQAIISLSVAGILALAYSLPIFKSKKGGLRQIPGLKTLIIGLIWASSTVLVPMMASGEVITQQLTILLFIKRFLLVFSLALLFDLRDMETDQKHNLKTIPVALGAVKTKWLCFFLICIHSIIIFFADIPVVAPDLIVIMLIYIAINIYLIIQSFPRKSDYFYLFWVDGMFVLQYFLFYFIKYMP
ncbi:UbiA family prenyltransferase [Solitalea canadensis]|uniref:4-hydroxybenzoate polyprenyltransferase-like prenyltransferase n=1 Tax=Solitalea canadensis (strain ATCC 29591 / DSM 3403 / JCM 21819 / LMG 8368 / NBRC 15130 / NCIMB 12057 / USAM 9D) TaxID=929556 RepID=H8KX17_SOLCM|nr:UbiA family prenyltransferase [Solitalea canadensis]AFD08346.1 4-hydroxybenzoate polyprenyltransferase-like prenyltransferase [Solitalea canadensis DSM 3403]